MTPILKKRLDAIQGVRDLSNYKRQCLEELLSFLQKEKQILGLFLGGSLVNKRNTAKADIDLFCLVNNVPDFEKIVQIENCQQQEVEVVIYQGWFAWTEIIYTLFYKGDPDFSIDLCLIDKKKLPNFYWEPKGVVLIDKNGLIKKNRVKQLSLPSLPLHPLLCKNPFSLSIITLKKISKSIYRGHYWNAMDMVMMLRRYVFQIIRVNLLKDTDFWSTRTNKNIEDILPEAINKQLAETAPVYELISICDCTIVLISLLEGYLRISQIEQEQEYYDWIFSQLTYEREKLIGYKKMKNAPLMGQ